MKTVTLLKKEFNEVFDDLSNKSLAEVNEMYSTKYKTLTNKFWCFTEDDEDYPAIIVDVYSSGFTVVKDDRKSYTFKPTETKKLKEFITKFGA